MPLATRCSIGGCWLLLCVLSMTAAPSVARAHDPGLSDVQVELGRRAARVEVSFAGAEFGEAPPRPADVMTLAVDGRPLALVSATAETDATDALIYRLAFEQAGAAVDRTSRLLEVQSRVLERAARGHRQLVRVRGPDGQILAEEILDATRPLLSLELGASQDPGVPVRSFVWLGLEHILEGYDHLAFVLGLILGLGSFRSIAATITAFTLAHSLSLAGATFGLLGVPSGLVEVLIGLSVVYVGCENLLGRSDGRRFAAAFLFGLVHGLGFASVLAELGTGTGLGLVWRLLSFNVGVELGQIGIAALIVPALWWARSSERVGNWVIRGASLGVVAAGSFWVLERVLG